MFRIRLKSMRESRHMSQKELATAFSVTQGTVGNWESGTREPNFDTLSKLADYFDCSVDYLLGRVDNPDLVIKKAPPESDFEQYTINRDVSPLTADELAEIRRIIKKQTGGGD